MTHAVNDELSSLKKVLDAGLERLAPGGRWTIITFHSWGRPAGEEFRAHRRAGLHIHRRVDVPELREPVRLSETGDGKELRPSPSEPGTTAQAAGTVRIMRKDVGLAILYVGHCMAHIANQAASNSFGPAFKAFLLCLLIGGSGVGYVGRKNNCRDWDKQIKAGKSGGGSAEAEREATKAISFHAVPRFLGSPIKALSLGLGPPQPRKFGG